MQYEGWGGNLMSFDRDIIVTSHERHGVSNSWQLVCLFDSMFMITTRNIKFPYKGNPPLTLCAILVHLSMDKSAACCLTLGKNLTAKCYISPVTYGPILAHYDMFTRTSTVLSLSLPAMLKDFRAWTKWSPSCRCHFQVDIRILEFFIHWRMFLMHNLRN